MFRSAKPKKNKRRRVAEDEDEQRPSGSNAEEDVPVVPVASDRRAINTFSVQCSKDSVTIASTLSLLQCC